MTDGPYPNHLAELMRASGLTDPALAGRLGISKQQIFNLRRGHRKLTVEWAKQLAPHLGVSWQRLITGADPADQAEAGLLAAFRSLDERDQETALRIIQSLRRDDPPALPRPLPRPLGPDPPRPFSGGSVAKPRLAVGSARTRT